MVKTVAIYSNDPLTPVKTIRLSGTVKPLPTSELSVVPSLINAGNIRKGESIIRDIELINSGGLDLSVNEILNAPNCRTELVISENEKIEIPQGEGRLITLVISPKNKKILKVICRPDVLRGQFQERMTIKSNARRTPVYVLSITGFIE